MTALSTLLGGNRAFGRGYIDGLILANGTDADHDINIAVGECRDSTNTYNMVLGSTLVKQIDASWAAGNNAGGLDTGAVGNSTWYHVWLIRKDSDGSIDALFSTSATAPTMPAGYTYKRRLGSVLTNGSGNILGFIQNGDTFLWKAPIEDVSGATWNSAGGLVTLSTPLGIITNPILNAVSGVRSSYQVGIYVSSPSVTDAACLWPAAMTHIAGAVSQWSLPVVLGSSLFTDTSSRIRVRPNYDTVTGYVSTAGWIDPRGRDS